MSWLTNFVRVFVLLGIIFGWGEVYFSSLSFELIVRNSIGIIFVALFFIITNMKMGSWDE